MTGDAHSLASGTIHSWRARITAGFAPASAAGEALATPLIGSSGDGRGSLTPFVLGRPGAAVVLIVPQGDAGAFADQMPQVYPLRVPCKGP